MKTLNWGWRAAADRKAKIPEEEIYALFPILKDFRNRLGRQPQWGAATATSHRARAHGKAVAIAPGRAYRRHSAVDFAGDRSDFEDFGAGKGHFGIARRTENRFRQPGHGLLLFHEPGGGGFAGERGGNEHGRAAKTTFRSKFYRFT